MPYVDFVIEIVSWNVNRRPLWSEALAGLPTVDIGLFQEAPRPSETEVQEFIPSPDGPWVTTHWRRELRTCIARFTDAVQFAPMSLRPAHDESDYSALGVSRVGTLTAARVLREDHELFTIVSAYGAWESPPDGSDLIYADASTHRLLSDLSALVTGRRGERVLVAGDFNILRGYGEHGSKYWGRRYDAVFDRAEAMGLRFVGPQAPHGRQADPWPEELPSDSRNVPTFHHSRQTPQSATRQLDFVFATSDLVDRVSVRALNEPSEWGPSDHCRLAISVDC